MSDELHVLYEKKEGIGWITLNRPEARNVLSPAMTDLLVDITDDAERDPAVRCVVLRGAGACFMAGGDVRHSVRCHRRLLTRPGRRPRSCNSLRLKDGRHRR